MKKGILFDMGETIIHNIDLNFKKGLSLLYDMNINLDVKKKIKKTEFVNKTYNIIDECVKSRSLIEIKLIDFIRLVSETYNLKFSKEIEEVEVDFSCNLSKIERVKDIELLLKYFKDKDYEMVVLSNTSCSKASIIKMLGDLNKYFSDVIVSSDYMVRKPNTAFFNLGISKLKGINKHDIYYIGNDFYNDIIGASKASIYPIWFNENKKVRLDEPSVNDYIEITKYKQLIEMDF